MNPDDLILISSSGPEDENLKTLNAYLGISFSMTKYFSRRRMKQYIKWAGANTSNLLIIVADHFEGYNFQVFKNLSPGVSFERAFNIGTQLARNYLRAVPASLASRVEVVLASELLRREPCAEVYALAKKTAAEDSEFKRDVEAAILDLLSGKLTDAGYSGVRLGGAIDILQHYIFEEIAVILYAAHLSTPPYPVAIFPYPPRAVITKIYDASYGNAFKEITRGEPFRFVQVAPLNFEVLKSQKGKHAETDLREEEEEEVVVFPVEPER